MDNQTNNMTIRNRFFSVGLVIFFAYAYYVANSFPARSARYPKGLLIAGILFSIGLFASTYFGKVELKKIEINRKEGIILALSIGLMITYIVLLNKIGYAVTTFFYILVQTWLIRKDGNKVLYFVLALVITAILFTVFGELLGVWLPKGILF